MSDNLSSSAQTPDPPTPHFFFPSNETPKPLGDFPTATASMYEIYLDLWWARNEKYNTFVSSCNYFSENTFGEIDDAHLLQLMANAVAVAHENLMEDFGALEEKLRSGTIEADAGELAGVGGIHVVAVPEAHDFHTEEEEEVVVEIEGAEFPGDEN